RIACDLNAQLLSAAYFHPAPGAQCIRTLACARAGARPMVAAHEALDRYCRPGWRAGAGDAPRERSLFLVQPVRETAGLPPEAWRRGRSQRSEVREAFGEGRGQIARADRAVLGASSGEPGGDPRLRARKGRRDRMREPGAVRGVASRRGLPGVVRVTAGTTSVRLLARHRTRAPQAGDGPSESPRAPAAQRRAFARFSSARCRGRG